jgi:hypothetical protein
MTPEGFAALAAVTLAQLREYGKAFLYTDAAGHIMHKDPEREVAIAHVPSLIIDPSAILENDEIRQTVTVSLEGVQILNHSGLVLETNDEWEDEG